MTAVLRMTVRQIEQRLEVRRHRKGGGGIDKAYPPCGSDFVQRPAECQWINARRLGSQRGERRLGTLRDVEQQDRHDSRSR